MGSIIDKQAFSMSKPPPLFRRPHSKPMVCYVVESLPPKKRGDVLYSSHRTAVPDGNATLASHLLILPCNARLWRVPTGHLWRVVCSHGPQVANMNSWRPPRSTREVLHEQDEADSLDAPDHGGQALVKEALPEAARRRSLRIP
jgi:uncharacterized protein YcgI (DUF1989 family)